MKYKFFSIILVLALASMACGFTVDIPKRATPGPDITDEITVAVPDADETRLTIAFGAGELKLSPGRMGNWSLVRLLIIFGILNPRSPRRTEIFAFSRENIRSTRSHPWMASKTIGI